MNQTREAIYGGLLDFLEDAAGFNFVTRQPILESEITTANMPALEQLVASEDAQQQGLNLPPKWIIRQGLMVYVASADPALTDTAINNLLDSIETALAPSKTTGYQTLGGLVTSCRFMGVIQKDPGFQSGIGAAAIAIELVTTS